MFFSHTLLPLSIALAVLVVARVLPMRLAAPPVLLGWISAIAGAAAYRAFFTAMSMGAQASLGPKAWRTASRTFFTGVAGSLAQIDFQHVLAAAWLAACVIAGCVLLWRLRGTAANNLQSGRVASAVFFFTSAGASVFGPATMILGGSNGLTTLNDYLWTMHYMHPTFLLPLFAWPSLIGLLPNIRVSVPQARSLSLVAAMTCLIVPLTAFARIPSPPVALSEYTPEFVSALDQQAGKYGLKYGIGGYWQARLITLLSKRGIRAYPADGSINPYLLVSNSAWYSSSLEDRFKPPCFSFIVLNDPLWKLTRSAAVRLAGEPSYEIDAGGVPVLIYADGPSGNAKPRCIALPPGWGIPVPDMTRPLPRYTSEMSSSVKALRLTPSERKNIPLNVINKSGARWSSFGKFPVTLSYRWFAEGRILPIEGERTLLPGALGPESGVFLPAVVIAPPEPGSYVLRLSLVQEGVTWFFEKGGSYVDIPAVVAPASGTQEPAR